MRKESEGSAAYGKMVGGDKTGCWWLTGRGASARIERSPRVERPCVWIVVRMIAFVKWSDSL